MGALLVAFARDLVRKPVPIPQDERDMLFGATRLVLAATRIPDG
jgi:hypothetical protein